MAQTKHRDKTVNTDGELPAPGETAEEFVLVSNDMKSVRLSEFKGKNVVLNIFPSIDTGVCATSVREFNKRATSFNNTVVLCISRDLPYAFRRFCGAEGIDNVITLSDFRNHGFAAAYGIELIDGIMAGLLARAIVVIDKDGKVVYNELVPSIGQEPDYEAAVASMS